MRILVTGGTGFIGRALVDNLLTHGHHVTLISRQAQEKSVFAGKAFENLSWLQWDFSKPGELQGVAKIEAQDLVINLAGEGIADKPWSEKRKQMLRQSRIDFTRHLIQWIKGQSWEPAHWLNASAIGYYGTGETLVTEEASPGKDFAAALCNDWEEVVTECIDWPCRKVLMRFGVVLGQGGMLKKLKPSFLMGMGAKLSSGRQGFSWVHLDDLLAAITWLMDHPDIDGPVNITAPKSVNNAEFTQAFAKAIHRPAWMTMPSFVLKLMFGEMADTLLLSGQRVYPKKLELSGFTFKYPDINTALAHLFR